MSTSISRSLSPRAAGGLPSWLPVLNRVIVGLQRVGFVVGSMHVLAVPGRRSGVMRSTQVSMMTVDGERYIVAGLDDADWVLNDRAAGRGVLQRGRTDEQVSLMELPVEEKRDVLRGLGEEAVREWYPDFASWAHRGQQEPDGEGWRTWLMMAGRGFGKTRAGAEWSTARR